MRCCVDEGCNHAPVYQIALRLRTPTRFGESDAEIFLPQFVCPLHRPAVRISEERWNAILNSPLTQFLGTVMPRTFTITFHERHLEGMNIP